MNREQIEQILNALNAQKIRHEHSNVSCCCLLAEWTHASGSDSDPSMGIQIVENGPSLVNCFACGGGSTFIGLLAKLRARDTKSGIDYSGLTQVVAKYETPDINALAASIGDYGGKKRSGQIDTEIPFENAKPFLGRIPNYCFDRGLTMETCEIWSLGYDPQRERLWIPVVNKDGKLVGGIGRALLPVESPDYPKYWNYWSDTYKKSEHLLGENFFRGKTLILVEGPLDVIYTWQSLRLNGMLDEYSVGGIIGVYPSKIQMNKAITHANQIVLLFDNDEAGQGASQKVMRMISHRITTLSVRYPEGEFKDPCDLSHLQLAEILSNASLPI